MSAERAGFEPSVSCCSNSQVLGAVRLRACGLPQRRARARLLRVSSDSCQRLPARAARDGGRPPRCQARALRRRRLALRAAPGRFARSDPLGPRLGSRPGRGAKDPLLEELDGVAVFAGAEDRREGRAAKRRRRHAARAGGLLNCPLEERQHRVEQRAPADEGAAVADVTWRT